MRVVWSILTIAAMACGGGPASDAASRDKAFWLELAKECTIPPGESAAALVNEAVGFLGSPDPVWRDDIGFGVVASCVYQQRRLNATERQQLVARLSGNLRSGIGEQGNESALSRSFSALDLSILAGLELEDPALDAQQYRRLLDDAMAYLRDERDLRGIEPQVGWIHATAHTADLLKFLARDERFTPADQSALLQAAWIKLTAPGTPVFTHAEDERLAAALVSITRRPDFKPESLDPWLAQFVALEKSVWEKAPPDPATLDASQNARNLLRSFYVLLSLPKPEPRTGQLPARDRALLTLQQIRR